MPFVWYLIDSFGAPLRIEPTSMGKLCGVGRYPDEFSRWIDGFVGERTGESRCVALAKGDAIGSKMVAIPVGGRDTRVDVLGHHVDSPRGTTFNLPFTRSGLFFKRMSPGRSW